MTTVRPVFSAEEAVRRVGPEPLLPIDVRWSLAGGADRAAYEAGHIPGAVFVDFDADMCGPAGPDGRHPLPDPGALQAALRAAGVDDDTDVLIYDGGDMLAAARTWWTLAWAGLPRVHVLDGGFPAWRAAGGEVSLDVPRPKPGTATTRPGGLPVLDAEAASRTARDGVLIDVRAAPRYRGETEPIDPVAGHVPGAVNRPGEAEIAEGGGFVDVMQLRALFSDIVDSAEANGRKPPHGRDSYMIEPTGVYCGSGVTAARTALAMTAAGLPTPAVYVGSWSQWIADGDRPVALGDE
ncbi:MAG: sulfurtransferase [Stackebrandtia sp.]